MVGSSSGCEKLFFMSLHVVGRGGGRSLGKAVLEEVWKTSITSVRILSSVPFKIRRGYTKLFAFLGIHSILVIIMCDKEI